jgi:hypothetical protein
MKPPRSGQLRPRSDPDANSPLKKYQERLGGLFAISRVVPRPIPRTLQRGEIPRRARATLLIQKLDVPVGSIDADPLPISDQPCRSLDAHDGRQAVLPRDHCAMGHQTANLRYQAGDE